MAGTIARHTPGPWVDWHRTDGAFHIAGQSPKVYVAQIIGPENDPVVEANGRLIQAAPDLLDKLETAYALLRALPPESVPYHTLLEMWMTIRAAGGGGDRPLSDPKHDAYMNQPVRWLGARD